VWLVLALLVMGLGLASRVKAFAWPGFVGAYVGDMLWALMVFLLLRFAAPTRPASRVAVAALAFSFAVELSQLSHAPWLEAARRTLPGRLVLGQGFLWSDLACYSVGVLLGLAVDRAMRPKQPVP
jgi:hypothetical protein